MPFLIPIVTTALGAVGLGGVASWLGGETLLAGIARFGLGLAAKYALGAILDNKPKAQAVRLETSYGEAGPRVVALGMVGDAGHRIYRNAFGKGNRTVQDVYVHSHFRIMAITRVRAEGEWKTLENFNATTGWSVDDIDGSIRVKTYLGLPDQAADAYLIDKSNPAGRWTTDHKGVGLSYSIATTQLNRKNITQPWEAFFEIKGAPLYDWRKDDSAGGDGDHRWDDQDTWEFSENPVLMMYALERGFYIGEELIVGKGVAASRLPLGQWTLAANICDEDVEGIARYSAALMAASGPGISHNQNLQPLLEACAATWVEDAFGEYPIVGATQSIVMTFTDDDLMPDESFRFSKYRPQSELVNTVAGTWLDPDKFYQAVPFTTRVDDNALAEDGESLAASIPYGAINKSKVADRLADIAFKASRFQANADVCIHPSFLDSTKPGTWIRWNSAEYGDRKFQITEKKLGPFGDKSSRNVYLTLQEVGDGIFDGSEYTTVPVITLPPGTGDYQSELVNFHVTGLIGLASTGSARAGMRAEWNAPEDVTITGVDLEYGPILTSGTAPSATAHQPVDVPPAVSADVFQGVMSQSLFAIRYTLKSDPPRTFFPSSWTEITTPEARIVGTDIADGAISITKFADTITPVELGTVVPSDADPNNFEGRQFYNTATGIMWTYKSGHWVQLVASNVLDGSITNAKLANAAVDASKLANNAVTELKIAAGAVTSLRLALGSVLSDRLANAAVTVEKLADGAVGTTKIADGALSLVKFATGVRPIEVVSTLPTTGNTAGRTVFLTTDGKLYRYVGAPTNAFVASISAGDITGQVGSSQIADAAIDASKIADGAATLTKFATALRPVEIASTLPTVGNVAGRTVFLTTDGKLYRYVGAPTNAFVSSVAAGDLTGQIVSTQITDGAISTPKLAAGSVAAINIQTDSITAGQIQAGAIGVSELAANAVTAVAISSNTITSDKMVANSITARELVLTDWTNLNIDPYFANNAAWALVQPAFVFTTSTGGGYNGANTFISVIGANSAARSNPIPTVEGDQLSLRVIAKKLDATAGIVRIFIRYLDAAGANAGNSTVITWTTADTTSYVTKVINTVAPTGTVAARIEMDTNGAAVSGRYYLGFVGLYRRANADLIVDGAITADKLAVNSVTAGAILAGTITSTEIAVNAITAKNLVLTDWNNVVPDNLVTDPGVWAMDAGWTMTMAWSSSAWLPATNLFLFTYTGQSAGLFNVTGKTFAVDATTEYFTSFKISRAGGTVANVRVQMLFQDKTGASLTAATLFVGSAPTGVNTITNSVTPPVGAVTGQIQFYVSATSGVDSNVFVGSFNVRPKNAANLIVDGAITANALATNSVTAVAILSRTITTLEIATGTILADNIATGAITAVQIRANAVTAAAIMAGTITGDKMVANSITTREMVITNFLNLIPDPYCAYRNAWQAVNANVTFRATPGAIGYNTSGTDALIASGTTSTVLIQTQDMACEAGESYELGAVGRFGTGGSVGRIRCYIRFVDSNGSSVNTAVAGTWTFTDTGHTYKSTVVTAGANASKMRVTWDTDTTTPNAATVIEYTSLRKRYDANLIVDGAITANKLAVNSVSASNIQANSIAVGMIQVGAVGASQISVTNLSSINANLGTITAGSLNINSLFTVSSAGAVVIKSAASGARLEISNSSILMVDAT